MLVDKQINLKVTSNTVFEEHAVRPYMAAQQRIKECMAFWLGCTRAKCGVPNLYEKAVSSEANCRKGNYLMLLCGMLFKAFSRYEEYCHNLASTERVWLRASAVLLVQVHFPAAASKYANVHQDITKSTRNKNRQRTKSGSFKQIMSRPKPKMTSRAAKQEPNHLGGGSAQCMLQRSTHCTTTSPCRLLELLQALPQRPLEESKTRSSGPPARDDMVIKKFQRWTKVPKERQGFRVLTREDAPNLGTLSFGCNNM
eukprot:1160268-Pelagomonas_calceolata.AAC.12